MGGHGPVLNDTSGDLVPVSRAEVQVWRYRVMDLSEGPRYYGCPLEYLVRVPAGPGYDRSWRLKWLAEHPGTSAKERTELLRESVPPVGSSQGESPR